MLRIIQKWIIQKFHLWMIYKHAQNHPKVDCTKHPISDDLETCSLSSKSGLYKSSKFGRCIIIQKWIVQKFHLWMIYKHAQNHPKVDYTKHPISDDLETCLLSSKSGLYKRSNFGRCIIIQKWIVQKFHLWMIYKHAQNHPKVDYTKHPISDDLETCSLSSKSGLYKSSKFG